MDRRTLLRTSVQLTLLAPFARLAHALPNTDARFVIVILRGALDGLAAVPPYGESQYKSLRGALALDSPGTTGGVLKLDGLFGLHLHGYGSRWCHRDRELRANGLRPRQQHLPLQLAWRVELDDAVDRLHELVQLHGHGARRGPGDGSLRADRLRR